ncbi:MAG TPA: FKBP-type peptidyl-prolyl cis-trans isomerase [Tangfeifania sp.]|nr:FKBP-type peptidyl-prolyl cis-trans isomerase [Tangfeifania sp.]
MRKSVIYFIGLFLLIVGVSCQQNGGVSDVKLETPADSAGYAIGILVGNNNKEQVSNAPGGADISIDAMVAGFAKAARGEETDLTPEEADRIVREFFTSAGEREGQLNLEAGNAFLQQNKERPEVKVTESGMQYEVLQEGDGPVPEEDDRVRVHYHGTLIDGTVFDSSVERGEPAVFGVTQVIPGWTEALQMMPAGSKWKIYLPSDLAYGERGAGGDIGPNETLIFEVELLEIVEE